MQYLQKLFIFLLCLELSAQNGEQIFQFLNIPTSARQTALAGYAGSKYDRDPNMALQNPSLLNEEMNRQLGATYTTYLADIAYGNFSYAHQLSDYDFIAIHGRYMNYGDFAGYDEGGNYTGDFKANDASITLGYAYQINEYFTVGTNLSYVTSKIETYTASAITADLGVTFHDYDFYNTVGLTLRNVGYLIDPYEDTKEDLPVQLNLSYSWTPENLPFELTLALHDLQKWDIAEPINENTGKKTTFGREMLSHVAVGAELLPDKGFHLRFGYNFKRGTELAVQDARSFAGLTFGFGFRVSKFRFDYAHARYHNSSNVNSFGLRMNLGAILNPRYY